MMSSLSESPVHICGEGIINKTIKYKNNNILTTNNFSSHKRPMCCRYEFGKQDVSQLDSHFASTRLKVEIFSYLVALDQRVLLQYPVVGVSVTFILFLNFLTYLLQATGKPVVFHYSQERNDDVSINVGL